MKIVTNIPRRVRTAIRVQVDLGILPLILVGPKQLPGYAGQHGYFFATRHQGKLVLVSKVPAKTRDAGRSAEAIHRFGRKASEYRQPKAA